jgi:hypothetical protein
MIAPATRRVTVPLVRTQAEHDAALQDMEARTSGA